MKTLKQFLPKYHLWIVEKYARLDLREEEIVTELHLFEAGGLLQLGREGSHLGVQHIRHQIILQTVYQKGHMSSSLVLWLDTASLKRTNSNTHGCRISTVEIQTSSVEMQIQPDGWLCFAT